ncbi:MAG: hypothetical protein E6R13_01700 [Spirochaetes bacterium]|nr:MAG: hypothetical protein E6R13_01700 [Spirochaetota bacterium]
MKKIELERFANAITNCNIKLHKQIIGGKWYECKYTSEFDEIELNVVYGISINDNSILFDFKTGKSEDSIYKTFITQYINKYEIKRLVLINDELRYKTKQECIEEFRNNNRVSKYCFYTTLYGIGFFSFFMNENTILDNISIIGKYLNDNNISYKRGTSEAGWVTRLIINKNVELHNNLLSNFIIENFEN